MLDDDRVAEELLAPALRVAASRRGRRRRRSASSRAARRRCRSASGLRSDSATGISCVLARMRVRPWRTVSSASARGADDDVAGEHRVGLLRVDAHLVQRARACRRRRTNDSTEPPFCAKPMKSSTLRRLAFEVRGHRDQRADRDDAGAADAGDEQVVRAGPVRAAPAAAARRRARRSAPRAGRRARRRFLRSRAADDADEARAEALGAGVVLVAARSGRSCACGRARSRAAAPRRSSTAPPQSPQPSQTRSLMKRRRAGSTSSPFLRRRRFSAAQVCS